MTPVAALPLVYCAIDTVDLQKAIQLAQQIVPVGCGIKLGLEFFLSHGPQGVQAMRAAHPSASIFLDLKCHDIPNTVAGAMRAVAGLGIDFVNVHASGGFEMMKIAQQTLQQECTKLKTTPPKLLAVTVLTSMDVAALEAVGQSSSPAGQVVRLARLTQAAGLAGVVCSAEEIALLRRELGPDFILMVPGIRPAGAALGDQKRVMTPLEAKTMGASHLVIGRPITESANPLKAAVDILTTL